MSEENPQKKNISTFHSTPKTALNLSQIQEQSMHFLSHQNKIYSKSCKAKKAITKYFDQVHREDLQNNIKRSILDKLDRESKQRQFQTKFNKYIPTKSFTHRNLNTNTTIQLEQKQRERFLSSYNDVIKLQLQCRLRQFHFASQQKVKSKTQYLKKLPLTSRHRRVTSKKKQTSKLFEKQNEKKYRVTKNLNYIKHDKFIEKCSEMGKNSISFKRQRNFQVIQYVIKQGHKKLLQSRQQPILSQQQQRRFNKIMRLYLQFADYSDAYRMFYEYISEQSCQKLKTTICTACSKIKPKMVEQQINELFQYKTNKFLYFEDFNQLLQNLSQKYQHNLIEQIQAKFPKIFNSEELNQYMQKLGPQVRKWISKNKIDVAIKILFYSVPAKLNMGKYLNIKTINEIFKKYELVPQIFWQNKLLFYCMWLKKRRQGLTFEELLEAIVYIMLSRNGKPQSFYTGLKQLNLGVKLLK